VSTPLPGDFGLVRTPDLMGALIRLGTRSPANHAFIYVGAGNIVEAAPGGARVRSVAEYGDRVRWSSIALTPAQRVLVVDAARSLVGRPYGFLDIAALALASFGLPTGWVERRVARCTGLICSQLVALAYEAAGIELSPGDTPATTTPADLLCVVDGLD